MREFHASYRGGRLPLGKQGENKATRILFPFRDYKGYSVTILHQRATDTQPYPITAAWSDDGLVWIISNVDTSIVGAGKLEIHFSNGEGTLAKSVTYHTSVDEALTEPSEEPPDPYSDWYEDVLAAAGEAKSAKIAAAGSATSAAASASSAASSALAASESAADVVTEEATRKAAEAERTSAEQDRVAAETGRVMAEMEREAYVTQLKADVAAGKFDGKDGAAGRDGVDGCDGSDASVTSANITTALGYTPANDTIVTTLSQTISDQSTAITNLQTGKADKTEIPNVPVQDVQINGTSILSDGVANVPLASQTAWGLSKYPARVGIVQGTDYIPYVSNK